MLRTFSLLILISIYERYATEANSLANEQKSEFIEASNAASNRDIIFINLTNLTIIRQPSDENATSSSTTVFPNKNNNRIVGGRKIAISETPWQVAIIQEGTFVCGGSIISRSWVLTAAHCVYGYTQEPHAVRAGSTSFRSGGQLRKINRIVYHGDYNTHTSANDIALMHTSRPFKFGSKVQAVQLPSNSSRPKSYFASGWGTLSENSAQPSKSLRGVTVYPVKRKSCANAYRAIGEVTSKQLCAYAPQKDSCQGDSGGALTHTNIQYGIVSYGVGCARAKYPGVYTNVYKYRSFIKTVTKSLK